MEKVMKKKALTPTQKVIQSQLLENTGRAMCDSGDYYGRNYERNQKKGIDFNEDIRVDEYGFTIPVQIYMDAVLEYTPTCKALERKVLAGLKKDKEIDYKVICYRNGLWIGDILNDLGCESEDGFEFRNTYNGECDLSQTLQTMNFRWGKDDYVIIETHNGCDVRGGYSTGRIYKIKDNMYDYYVMGIVMSDFCTTTGDMQWDFQYSMINDCQWNEKNKRWEYKGEEVRYYPGYLQ